MKPLGSGEWVPICPDDICECATVDQTTYPGCDATNFHYWERCVLRPDQLHIVGPIPNMISVGRDVGTIDAFVQANFTGLPDWEVVFTKLAGDFTFTSGNISSNGTYATETTDSNGVAEMSFTADGDGSSLIEVTVPGTELTAFSFFEIVAALPLGDIDGDGDIDLDDFSLFAECLGGPGNPNPPPGCDAETQAAADYDADGDVDVNDLAMFQEAFSGS